MRSKDVKSVNFGEGLSVKDYAQKKHVIRYTYKKLQDVNCYGASPHLQSKL
jgi:hypothetical protein